MSQKLLNDTNYTEKAHLKRHTTIPGTWFRRTMSQCSGTHLLTRLVQHATLSESGPIRTCSYTRDRDLITYSGMPKICYYFTYDPLRRACPNDVACMDPLIVVCYMGMSKSIRTAGVPDIGVFSVPL